jgi:hypothetical protein
MKGDFSKYTFDGKKHYRNVLLQQGRVLVDADWNEQTAIISHRTETGTLDIIGDSGAPMNDAGFGIIPLDSAGNPSTVNAVNIRISKGRFYVDGILCENDTDTLYSAQPDFIGTPLPTDPGTYTFYLDLWQRLLTALEVPAIREVALGGPDTATRVKTIWQVKFVKAADAVTCLSDLGDVISVPTGKLSARSEPTTGTDDPCGLVTTGGFRRLENQLYRVEIHTAGATRAAATFKWSRDNGSVLVKWEGQDAADPNKLLVSSTGRDQLLGFLSGNWVELIDDRTDLLGKPGILAQLSNVDPTGNILTINPATIKDPDNPGATSVTIGTRNPRIRRWDSAADLTMNPDNATWIDLEDGVQVNFADGSFRSGDYWLIPGRTAEADIEWPFTDPQSPGGIRHHFAKLAIANLTAVVNQPPIWTVTSDCRPLFPPLTELTTLYYVGGDGQEAMPGQALPATLKAGVANGPATVTGANIKFEIVAGGGALNPASGIVPTNANGIAECAWTLGSDTSNLNLQVKASLLDANGVIMTGHLPLIFNAGFNIASNILYDGTGCDNWGTDPHTTVADAITSLCKRNSSGNGKKKCSVSVGKGGDFETIAAAIASAKDVGDLCICLLPGTHEVEGTLGNQANPLDLLKISACGGIIQITSESLQMIANKLILQGVIIQMAKVTKAQIRFFSDDMDVHHCVFQFPTAAKPDGTLVNIFLQPLKKIQGTPVIRWNNNLVNAGYNLAIFDGFDMWIEDNDINGSLSLQFSTTFKALAWEGLIPARPIRSRIQANMKDLLIQEPGTIHLRGNFLDNVIMDGEQILLPKPQSVYASIFVAENVFRKGNSSFAGISLNIVNNQFLGPAEGAIVAFVVGATGVIMGNSEVPVKGALIDTIFVRPVIDPKLNIINVA